MRRAHIALLASVAFTAMCAPAWAEYGLSDASWGEGVEIIADEEMNGLRGGLAITPNIQVNFGAQITTLVNGTPALTTNITWTDMGQFVEETVGDIGERIDALTPEQKVSLGVEDLSGGVVISDTEGVTALVHTITDGALQNIIMNTASGRDLRQEVDVTLELPGFEAVQDSLLVERIGIRIDEDLRGVMFDSGF